MKFHIKALVASIVLGFALVSCNSNFDDEMPNVNYPQKMELGSWTPEYIAPTKTTYTLNLTVNEAGDTICDVTTYNPVTKKSNVLAGGAVKYNEKVGMITADYATSFYGTAARVTLTFRDDLKSGIVNIYTLSQDDDGKEVAESQGSFRAVKSSTFSVYGMWTLGNGETVQLNSDGTASVVVGEEVTATGTYTFDGNNGTFTTSDGKVYAFAKNDKGQMHVTVNGETYYAAHSQTAYTNDWIDFAVGKYYTWLFGQEEETTIEYSDCRAEYRVNLNIFGVENNYLSFNWNRETNEITPLQSSFDTNYTHKQDGQTLGKVFGTPAGAFTFDPEKKVFTFTIKYEIPGVGAFGTDKDKFTVTDMAE